MGTPLKNLGWWKVRDGHPPNHVGWWKWEMGTPLGWCRFQKMPNLCSSNGKKPWHTLSIIYSINPKGCPSLATTSLGQAVLAILLANIYISDLTYLVVLEILAYIFHEASAHSFFKIRLICGMYDESCAYHLHQSVPGCGTKNVCIDAHFYRIYTSAQHTFSLGNLGTRIICKKICK